MELAHKGVRLNVIAPGWVTVENYYNVLPGFNERPRARTRRTAFLSASGVPRDIAALAVFLCSDEARYIVGQTIAADGGTTSLMSLISDFRNESGARFGAGYLPGVESVRPTEDKES